MNDIIRAIFLSETCGVQRLRLPQDKNYEHLTKKEDELYNRLQAAPSPELFETFSEFLEAVIDVRAIISEQYYTAGFKTGLRLATEVFDLSDIFDQ